MRAKVEITKLQDGALASLLDNALATNFRCLPTLALVERDGQTQIVGRLPDDFELSLLGGLDTWTPALAIGVDFNRDGVRLQSGMLDGPRIESFLQEVFGGFAATSVTLRWCLQRHGDAWCWLVTVERLENPHNAALLAGYGRVPSVQQAVHRRSNEKSGSYLKLASGSVKEYLRRRAEISPGAIELKYPPSELACLLGLAARDDSGACGDDAQAALGMNAGVESAVYVRHGVGPAFTHRELRTWIHRGTEPKRESTREGRRFRIDALLPGDHGQDERLSAPRRPKQLHVWPLGGDVFETLDHLEQVVADPREVFRDGRHPPAAFSQPRFGAALKELAVNALVHGEWSSDHPTNRDDRFLGARATAMVVVHLGNRIEFINDQAPRPLAKGVRDRWTQRLALCSNLHVALKDVGLAQGRGVGLQLVQARLVRSGLPAPLVLDTDGGFRVVMPLEPFFEDFVLPVEKDYKPARLRTLFVLTLCLLLRRVDRDSVSSALGLDVVQSAELLEALAAEGQLVRENPDLMSHFGRRKPLPVYQLADDAAARTKLKKLRRNAHVLSAPRLMSPRALLAVSEVFCSLRWNLQKFGVQEGDNSFERRSSEHFEADTKKHAQRRLVAIALQEAVFGPQYEEVAREWFDAFLTQLPA